MSVDDQMIVGGLEAGDVDGGPEHIRDGEVAIAVVDHRHILVADVDGVGRSVPGAVDAEIDVDVGNPGAGRVVEVDRVGPGERVDRDRLDVVQVHHDVALDAGEQGGVGAIAGQRELFVGGEAV